MNNFEPIPTALQAQARRAYEQARLRHALRITWFIAPLVAFSLHNCQQPMACLSLGLLLLCLTVGFRWRGQQLERAVKPGLAIGCLGFALPVGMHFNGHGCQLGACSGSCMLHCIGLGLLLGTVMVLLAIKLNAAHSNPMPIGAIGLIAGATAALGCLPLGITGAIVALTTTSLSSLTLSLFSPTTT